MTSWSPPRSVKSIGLGLGAFLAGAVYEFVSCRMVGHQLRRHAGRRRGAVARASVRSAVRPRVHDRNVAFHPRVPTMTDVLKLTVAQVAWLRQAATFRKTMKSSSYGWLPYGSSEWRVARRLEEAGLIERYRLAKNLAVYMATRAGKSWLADFDRGRK